MGQSASFVQHRVLTFSPGGSGGIYMTLMLPSSRTACRQVTGSCHWGRNELPRKAPWLCLQQNSLLPFWLCPQPCAGPLHRWDQPPSLTLEFQKME